MQSSVNDLAQTLLSYHRLNQQLREADCILGFGTNDDRVAERAAELFLQKLAPVILFSGAVSTWTEGLYRGSEAEHFADIAISRGVPSEKILIENKATNTGENVLYSRHLLEESGINTRRVIVVQKPYMERRSFATFRKVWPEPEVIVASPCLNLLEFPLPHLSMEAVVNIMVGDLDRILKYPQLGFQIPQEVPSDVLNAYERLIELGYDKHLVK